MSSYVIIDSTKIADHRNISQGTFFAWYDARRLSSQNVKLGSNIPRPKPKPSLSVPKYHESNVWAIGSRWEEREDFDHFLNF